MAEKRAWFYEDTVKKSKMEKEIRIQTDREFEENKFKKINNEYNAGMFSPRVCEGKVFIAEQKIREVKRLLFKPNSLEKRLRKRTRPNKLQNVKWGFASEKVESKSIQSDQFREKCDFYRLQNVKNDADKRSKFDTKINIRLKKN